MSALPEWARAHGSLTTRARIRVQPEDFRVEEVLGFEADGAGPHVMLKVEKRGSNTHWVAGQLARHAGVPSRELGYAGLKDRHAITVQHFTVNIDRKPEPDWSAVGGDSFKVLGTARHRRKLKPGVLKGNRFRLVLRDLSESAVSLVPKLEVISKRGVPNYFGSQRFGRDGANISKAAAMLGGKRIHDRRLMSLLLSTARSLIFNAVLSRRVQAGNWDSLLDGDVLMLDGSRSVFRSETGDTDLPTRIIAQDVHPTGPLWGRGESMAGGAVRALEEAAALEYPVLADGLISVGLEAARRSLRLPVRDFSWLAPDDRTLILEFYLPAGAYATAVLRELVDVTGVDADAEED